jgi:hypothetical protein
MAAGKWQCGGLSKVALEENGYFNLKTLAEYSGLSVRQLRVCLSHPLHPLPHYRMPNKTLVRKSDFDAWLLRFKQDGSRPGRPSLGDIVDDVVAGLAR